ncbi:hypothetical protein NE865_11243 [Phthorimaea operculella]|nr:hypothetical protein NE865_11243 [Phthorimaea operculella]
MGLVRGIPIEWDEEEIKDNITTPIGCGNIIKVRRLNYKVNIDGNTSWKPSQSVVVTFDGQVLPKRLFMCYNALPVEVYVYPTIQCFRCCKYGHTKMQCRSKSPKCFKCSKDHLGKHAKEEGSASCVMCGGRHFATDKACPENIRQKEIKHTMAHSCISYLEASKLFPPVSRSFADVVASEPNESINEEKNSPSRISYKKTVFKKPRSPPKTQGGYDRAAHSALLKEFEAPPSENGCAYAPKDSESEDFDMSSFEVLEEEVVGCCLLELGQAEGLAAEEPILANGGIQALEEATAGVEGPGAPLHLCLPQENHQCNEPVKY